MLHDTASGTTNQARGEPGAGKDDLCRPERKGPRDAEDTVGSNELIGVLGRVSRLLLISTLSSAAARAEDVAFWPQLCDNTPHLCAKRTYFWSWKGSTA